MTNTLQKIMHNGDEYLIPQYSVIRVTLTANGWSNDEQTVTATGVTATNTVVVSPVPTSMSDYTSGGVIYTAQGTDSLTFECTTTPSNDIDVNVVIFEEAESPTPPPTPTDRPDLDQYSLLGSTTLGFTSIHGIAISSDGTKLYAGPSNGKIRQYTLTGGLITGISAVESETSSSVNTRGLYVKPDGSRLFSVSDSSAIYNISMSTDFSLTGSTITSDYLSGIVHNDNPVGVRFAPDGDYFFTCRWDNTNRYLYKIPLTTAWDITSYTSTGATSVLLSEGYAYNVAISPTGLKVFAGAENYIYQYNLSSPRDITTAIYSGKSLAVTERATFSVTDDGDIFQTPTDSTGNVYQYRAS